MNRRNLISVNLPAFAEDTWRGPPPKMQRRVSYRESNNCPAWL